MKLNQRFEVARSYAYAVLALAVLASAIYRSAGLGESVYAVIATVGWAVAYFELRRAFRCYSIFAEISLTLNESCEELKKINSSIIKDNDEGREIIKKLIGKLYEEQEKHKNE